MRRFISVLIAVLMFMSISVVGFADMGPPAFEEYDVYVSNPDGITAKDYDEYDNEFEVVIPYKEKLHVTDENEDGTLYFDYKDIHGTASLNDVSKVVPKVDKNKYKISKTYVKIVIGKDGVIIRNGPAKSYEAVGKIPYGITFKSNYGIEDDAYGAVWLYVTYKGISGWVHTAEVGQQTDCVNVYTGKDNELEVMDSGFYLYSTPTLDKKVSGEIPKNTKLKYNYTYRKFEECYYVEYNGIKGWISEGESGDNSMSCIVACDAGVYTTGKISMYKRPVKGTPSGSIATIPANKVLSAVKTTVHTVRYYEEMYTWYLVSYDGQQGWIRTGDKTNARDFYCKEVIKISSARKTYSKPSKSAATDTTIPKGTTLDVCDYIFSNNDEEYYFTKYNGNYCWIKSSGDDDVENSVYDFNFSEFYKDPEVTTTTTTTTTTATTTAVSEAAEDTTYVDAEAPVIEPEGDINGETVTGKVSPKVIIICCAAAAIIVAATAAVLIVLVNKKNKQSAEVNRSDDMTE